MAREPIVTHIIGAGVTGLGFAQCFGADKLEILEASDRLGGMAASYKLSSIAGVFGFDVGGHWFHHQGAPEAVRLLDGLPLKRHRRCAKVFWDGGLYDFPLQASYRQHWDQELVSRITSEITEITELPKTPVYANYDDMLLRSYGPTLAELFFRPYNRKIFGIWDLSRVAVGWLDTVRNVRAAGPLKGYNTEFLYPAGNAGAEAIPRFLARGLSIRFRARVESINLSRRQIVVNGQSEAWGAIVSSIPLIALARLIEDLPPDLARGAAELRSSRGMVVNAGVRDNGSFSRASWVYFSDIDLPFYRIGFYSHVEPSLAPPGYRSVYVECSPLFFQNKEEALALWPRIMKAMIRVGVIDRAEDVLIHQCLYQPHLYCLQDEQSNHIRACLQTHGIFSIGRYGTWHWSSQHEDIQQAAALAATLLESNASSGGDGITAVGPHSESGNQMAPVLERSRR